MYDYNLIFHIIINQRLKFAPSEVDWKYHRIDIGYFRARLRQARVGKTSIVVLIQTQSVFYPLEINKYGLDIKGSHFRNILVYNIATVILDNLSFIHMSSSDYR